MTRKQHDMMTAFPALIITIGLSAGIAHATNGNLVGAVKGPGGGGLPGATVTASIDGESVVATVITGEGGQFRINGLEPGSYSIEGQLHGFHPTAASGIAVASDGTTRVTLALSIATFRDTTEVNTASPRDTMEASALRESAARDLGEALSRMPGVWKVRKGGIANDVVLRGFREDDITVLIDGARVAGACPNRMDPPAFHLDFAEVDRVELGPTSGRMVAQGSLGGMINVVTKKPGAGLHTDVSLAAGSYDMINPSATVSYGTEKLAVLGGLSHRSSRPFEDGTGRRFTETANYVESAMDSDAYDVNSGWARLYFEAAEGHELHLSYARQEADDVLYPALRMDAVTDDTDRLVVGYLHTPSSGILRTLRATAYGTSVDHWMVDSDRASAAGAARGWSMGTNATTRILGATVDAELGPVIVGFEAYTRNWDAWTEMAGMNYMRQFTIPDVDVDVVGLSARWKHELGAGTSIELGGRVDRVSSAADPAKANTDLYHAYHGVRTTSWTDVEPSASIRVTHELSSSLTLHGNLSRTARPPDPRERYLGLKRMGGDWVGNPDLDSSRSNGAELGLSWNVGSGVFTATTWTDRVDGYITLYEQEKINQVPGVMNTRAQSYANVDAHIRGAAVEATVAFSSSFFLSGNLSYARGTKTPDPARGIESTDLAEMPPLSGRLALRWQSPRWFAEVEGVGADRQSHVDRDLIESETPGWGILNLKAGLISGQWRLQVVLENVLDKTYREHFSYLRNPFRSGFLVHEPGRNLGLTIGWRL